MNKRDFYKELMSEYMFDKEKICANAKKGKLAGRRSLPIYIGMTAAVAAAVVIVGTAVFTNLDKSRNNGVQITSETAIAALNEQQRLDRVISEIQKNQNSEERIDVFVTFSETMSPKAAQNLLSQFSEGTVPVKMLCMEDGTRAIGTSEVGAVFKDNSGDITAAVISCPGYRLAEINANSLVIAAETVTEKDVLTDLVPLGTNVTTPDFSTSTGENSKPDNSDNHDNNNSNSNNNSSTHESPGIDDDPVGGQAGEFNGGETSNSGSGFGDTSNSEPNSGGDGSGQQGNTGTGTGSEEPSNPSEPSVTIPLPDGVKLPYNSDSPEKSSFITDDLGAQKAYFLSENVFYVKSENAVALYKWDGTRETLAARQEISDAKVAWVSENGLRMMVSGVEDGVRRKLFIIDAKNCTINDMRVDEMVGDGYIAEAAYNEGLDVFALNVVDADNRYIYTAKLSGYQPLDPQIVAFGSNSLSLLAAYGNAVYYSEIFGMTTSVSKYENGENLDVTTLDDIYVSTLNSAFTHSLMICSGGAGIFDPATESIIPITGDKATFGASAHSFSDGKSYFTVSSGAIVPESGITAIAKIDFTRSFSNKWAAAVSNGAVRIIPSVYTERVRSDGITFDKPEENATAQQRAAVNAAIGLLNAIANGSCEDNGIDTREKLIAVIDACFSQSEAQFIKARCEVSESGALSYTNGGFTAVNVSDTVLIIGGELTGTLYIKVGTFDGRTAYRTVPVTLTTENGRLLMDVLF